jgi:hypothetical protein
LFDSENVDFIPYGTENDDPRERKGIFMGWGASFVCINKDKNQTNLKYFLFNKEAHLYN